MSLSVTGTSTSKPGPGWRFSTLVLLTFSARQFFCRGCHIHCGMLSSIPGLQNNRTNTILPYYAPCCHIKISADISRYPLLGWETQQPPAENHWYRIKHLFLCSPDSVKILKIFKFCKTKSIHDQSFFLVNKVLTLSR